MKDMHIELDFDVTVQVGGKAVSVRDLLDVDETSLSNEYATQSARYAYFAVLEAQAHGLWQAAKEAREREEATAFIEFKDDAELIPKGSRSVSDKLAQELVAGDEQCGSWRAAEMDAEHNDLILRAVTRAFYMRASMLQSFGANARHEQDMDGISIREQDDASRHAKALIRQNRG